ncbi:MAG: hypothetical protein FWH37_09525 [Candidatus Bathyarchaeota archaeon]|nr:hypothetical protein [Candidatus Termiticorpusculum sp.]
MCKIISSDVIIGHCVLEAVKRGVTQVSFKQLIAFDEQIGAPLKEMDYFAKFSLYRVFEFEDKYPFFVSSISDDALIIDHGSNRAHTIERLKKYFRMGLPNVVIDTFTSASDKIFGTAR